MNLKFKRAITRLEKKRDRAIEKTQARAWKDFHVAVAALRKTCEHKNILDNGHPNPHNGAYTAEWICVDCDLYFPSYRHRRNNA